MKRLVLLTGILALAMVILVSCGDKQHGESLQDTTGAKEVEILQSWQGDYPVIELNLMPEKQRNQAVGFISDDRTFESVWKNFKPGEIVPAINFKNNLVLFVRNTQFYNRISIAKVSVTNGVAEVLAMETMSAIPIEDKAAMSLAVVSRQGIAAIKSDDEIIPVE